MVWSAARPVVEVLSYGGMGHTAGIHTDPDLISLRFGRRDIANLQSLRPALSGDDNGFHGGQSSRID